MIELAVMIEGQDGLTWERWMRLVKTAEDLGFKGLYRSDHYTNANPPDKESLELWVSLTWLASHTRWIEFGPLVSPVSFRHPTLTARMAAAVDDLSGGRLNLGLGAGWQEREHHNYGWDLLDIPSRFDRFEEGLKVITGLLHHDTPQTFQGKYYRLHEAVLLPRPKRNIPIVIGGRGPKRTLPLVARYAHEWNAVYQPAHEIAALNQQLDKLIVEAGRSPSEVRRSLMTRCVLARDAAELSRRIGNTPRDSLEARGVLIGTPQDLVEQLGVYAQAGVKRIMLQWLDLDDIEGLEALAKWVLPQVSNPHPQ
ncbi:MAG: LLM class F420-dependent oxidoreductase [Anaerolinea sp.]|nr:LLM class F420-dependent oxidoreductase [Anaerolinea sp.]CAG0952067.1 FMNH(2)-dependent dimethylsulfone monooxygenase [Anaerolineae bacterium]